MRSFWSACLTAGSGGATERRAAEAVRRRRWESSALRVSRAGTVAVAWGRARARGRLNGAAGAPRCVGQGLCTMRGGIERRPDSNSSPRLARGRRKPRQAGPTSQREGERGEERGLARGGVGPGEAGPRGGERGMGRTVGRGRELGWAIRGKEKRKKGLVGPGRKEEKEKKKRREWAGLN
jgi:hypothetical protein